MIDQEDTCTAQRTIGGRADPYLLQCDKPRGHQDEHVGANPIDPEAGDLQWSTERGAIVHREGAR
jgi:hypothetical protein